MIHIQGGLWRVVAGAVAGQQHRGVVPGGPQDRFSAITCNRIVGNGDGSGIIECDVFPLQLQFSHETRVVIGGAVSNTYIGTDTIARYTPTTISAGSTLIIEQPRRGARVYIAVAGGLRMDDRNVHGAQEAIAPELPARGTWAQASATWAPDPGWLRCLPGPEFHFLQSLNWAGPWRVSRASNHMGLRLEGAGAVAAARYDIPSSPVVDGTVQLTAAGPILLLRGRASLGGYPRILTVIDEDLDLAAQCHPGSAIRFELCDDATAASVHDAWALALPGV